MKLTEVFNGTPAQFFAQIVEFECDHYADGGKIAVDLREPMRAVQQSNPTWSMGGDPHRETIADKIGWAMDRIDVYESDVQADTARLVVTVSNLDNRCLFDIAAVQRPDGKTTIKARLTTVALDGAMENMVSTWNLIIDYLVDGGWCGVRATVKQCDPVDADLLKSLSQGEYNTLQLIVDGLKQQQIAQHEIVDIDAIKKRQQRIAEKLGIDGNATAEKLRYKGLALGMEHRPDTIKKFTPKV